MNQEEIEIFRNQRVASAEGQAVIARLNNDGTAGHSKGEFGISDNRQIWNENDRIIADCFSTSLDISRAQEDANCHIFKIAQHAPHDCGDPKCPGVINKHKLELYDKFQVAINEFAKAGLLT